MKDFRIEAYMLSILNKFFLLYSLLLLKYNVIKISDE
jgi:hypothetical protein